MGLFDRWYDTQVNNAIDVLNHSQNRILTRGAVNTLIKHPDANPFAIPSLVNVVRMYPDAGIRELAEEGLRYISQYHKDPVVRERANRALEQLGE